MARAPTTSQNVKKKKKRVWLKRGKLKVYVLKVSCNTHSKGLQASPAVQRERGGERVDSQGRSGCCSSLSSRGKDPGKDRRRDPRRDPRRAPRTHAARSSCRSRRDTRARPAAIARIWDGARDGAAPPPGTPRTRVT